MASSLKPMLSKLDTPDFKKPDVGHDPASFRCATITTGIVSSSACVFVPKPTHFSPPTIHDYSTLITWLCGGLASNEDGTRQEIIRVMCYVSASFTRSVRARKFLLLVKYG
jgi:hypothetical protein